MPCRRCLDRQSFKALDLCLYMLLSATRLLPRTQESRRPYPSQETLEAQWSKVCDCYWEDNKWLHVAMGNTVSKLCRRASDWIRQLRESLADLSSLQEGKCVQQLTLSNFARWRRLVVLGIAHTQPLPIEVGRLRTRKIRQLAQIPVTPRETRLLPNVVRLRAA